jgi:hypothetical protein
MLYFALCSLLCTFASEMENTYPSLLLEKAVQEFAKLPGVGRKTALRLVLHLLRQTEDDVTSFADSVSTLRRDIKHCRIYHWFDVASSFNGFIMFYLHFRCP